MFKFALPAVLTAFTLALASGQTARAEEPQMSDSPLMHVTKTPICGCCHAWAEQAAEASFHVETTDTADYVGMKMAEQVPQELWSCHTATVDGYIVEGHVPFEAVRKLLSERPNIKGISVPGMPAGSPGMGNDPTAVYDVIAYGGDAGEGEVFFTAGQ